MTGSMSGVRHAVDDAGRIRSLAWDDARRPIPFRDDAWGTGWYVRGRDGVRQVVSLQPIPGRAEAFAGSLGAVRFELAYAVAGDALRITAALANDGAEVFAPMTAGLCLGFDAYQECYPEWAGKPMPNVLRCERTHHWGFALSPDGCGLAWGCPEPVASYSIDYQPREHRIHSASVDLLNQRPLPARHPQHLDRLAPGERRSWTISLFGLAPGQDPRPLLAARLAVPIFAADRHTVQPDEPAQWTVHGPPLAALYLRPPDGGEILLEAPAWQDGWTSGTFSERQPGLYVFRAVCRDGREAEGSICVRLPWAWYLQQARVEGLRIQPTETHHAECIYPFFSYYLARQHFPDPVLDAACEQVFARVFPQHYDAEAKRLRVVRRIQDTAVWAGVLADRHAATGDEAGLVHAADLVDFLIGSCQGADGGFYTPGGTHYTSVIYLAKSIIEVMRQERPLAAAAPATWGARYARHRQAVARAIADLRERRDRVQTEGQQTYEDGMIACSLLQLAMYALVCGDAEERRACTAVAEELYEGHRSLTLSLHPDARVNGSTIRYWETQYTICLMANMGNSPCGWTAWKLYGDYYLYLLTGKERYLREAFNGLGACVQLLDGRSGRLRWGFTPDPFIPARWAVPARQADETREHDWVDGFRGEEYLEPISDWNRSKPIWRQGKWGIDNFTHEIFKCMEEMALGNAYVLVREDGTHLGYNCRVEREGEALVVTPTEERVVRLHINLPHPVLLRTTLAGQRLETRCTGLAWLGPGGIPEDLHPL